MGPNRTPFAARAVTILMVLVVNAAVETAFESEPVVTAFNVAWAVLLTSAALVVGWIFRFRIEKPKLPRPAGFTLLLLLIAPLMSEPIIRSSLGQGSPLELQMVNGLRTLTLGLLALTARTEMRRIAAVATLFLILFAAAMGERTATVVLIGISTVIGGLWLIVEHQLSRGDCASAVTAEVTVDRTFMRIPFREAVVFGGLAVAAVMIGVVGPKRVMLTLGELMLTSGGSGRTDPFARYGVGDGPEQVAGDSAQSAGMVESTKLIEDNQDSLIDAVNDMYGPPQKPPKDQDRMVAAGKVDVIEMHGKTPMTLRPSREFDTARRGPSEHRHLKDVAGRAMLEVRGRVPIHIRAAVWEAYSAEETRWQQGRKPHSLMVDADKDCWMKLAQLRPSRWYDADEEHRIAVVDLKDNWVPTPAMLTEFRIDRVDRAEYYEWSYEGVLSLSGRRRTPAGVVAVSRSRNLRFDRLPEDAVVNADRHAGLGTKSLLMNDLPDDLRIEFAAIARAWTEDLPRGPAQIAAIIERLRRDYSVDPEATTPSGADMPERWFLQNSKRGPDYLFASTACLLLRSLGYSSRWCTGYYAHPDHYDSESGYTPVRRDDLHSWPEVQLRDGHWLVLEPTPGYEVLRPRLTWRQTLLAAAIATAERASRHRTVLLIGLVAAVAALRMRRQVIDTIATAGWKCRRSVEWRRSTARAFRILERRFRWAGLPRTPQQTLAQWLDSIGDRSDSLHALRTTLEWAAYSPTDPPDVQQQSRLVCRTALDEWTLKKIRFSRAVTA